MSAAPTPALGPIEETLLVPLYGRACESRKKHALLKDPKAIEMVASIPWDYERFNQRHRLFSVVLRTAIFDEWVRDFLARHPEGTVIEIGTGLNTRFERLDNGRVHWFDLDLPAVIQLRRGYFADSERRTMLAASVTETAWMETVRRSPPPYFFVAETVLVYLEEHAVRTALGQIGRSFPDLYVALDTITQRALAAGNKDMARQKMEARYAWACEHPREIEDWDAGLRLVESRGLTEAPEPLRSRLSATLRAACFLMNKLVPQIAHAYRINLFRGGGARR